MWRCWDLHAAAVRIRWPGSRAAATAETYCSAAGAGVARLVGADVATAQLQVQRLVEHRHLGGGVRKHGKVDVAGPHRMAAWTKPVVAPAGPAGLALQSCSRLAVRSEHGARAWLRGLNVDLYDHRRAPIVLHAGPSASSSSP